MRNMHVTALMGEFDWGHTNNTSETTTPNAKKTMSWRWNCKWGWGGENVFPHAGESREVRGHDAAQLNRTANLRQDPLLLWWFFGGPLLCTNSKKQSREKIQKESYHTLRDNSEQRDVFQRLRSFGLKVCTVQKDNKKQAESSAGSESFTLYYSNPRNSLSYVTAWKRKWAKNLPNSKTNLF